MVQGVVAGASSPHRGQLSLGLVLEVVHEGSDHLAVLHRGPWLVVVGEQEEAERSAYHGVDFLWQHTNATEHAWGDQHRA